MLNDESNTQGIDPNKIPPKKIPVEEKNVQDPVADVSDHSIFDKPERELQNLADREALENQDVVAQPDNVIQEQTNKIDTLLQEDAAARSEDAEELKEEKPTLSPEPHFSHTEHDEELVYPEIKLKPRPETETQQEEAEPKTGDDQTPPPVPPIDPKQKWLHPESWRCLQSMPPKYRRPLVLLILIIIILIIISFLKPQAHSVQALEKANVANTTTSNSVITTPKSTQGGLSNVLEDANPTTTTPATSTTDASNTHENGDHSVAIGASNDSLATNTNTLAPLTADTAPAHSADLASSASMDTASTTMATTAASEQVPQSTQAMKVASASTTEAPASTAQNNDVFAAAEKANLIPAVGDTAIAHPAGKNRVLVMHRGVSLMQVFRNHHLHLSDIIAMSKVGHHGRLLSELNPGDKVTVKVTRSRHVSELILPNGGRFIRQANGSYTFTK